MTAVLTVLPASHPTTVWLEHGRRYTWAHATNGAQTDCYLGPVDKGGLRNAAEVPQGVTWCARCFPRACPTCRTGAAKSGQECPRCVAESIATDKRIERTAA